MDVRALLRALPAFTDKRDIIVRGNQSVRDIEKLVVNTHNVTSDDYDRIAPFFDSGNAPKKLFDFTRSLRYREEPENDQTTRSPGGILEMANRSGIDCKHTAGFIAGVLDALNRTGRHNYDWTYRFVSYDPRDRKAEHVMIVLQDSDTWIDPTPIKDKSTGRYITRTFNDRLVEPEFYKDVQPHTMLSYLHGVHYRVGEDLPGSSCLGNVYYGSGPQTIGQTETDVVTQLAGEAKAIAGELAESLPDGGFKRFLQTFMDDPVSALKNLLFGRKYTTGDYVLGEMYMRNILGMMEIQRRGQVPDEYVPQAKMFFSTALGIPIGSVDHLDALVRGVGDYMTWAGGVFTNIPVNQVERARRIITQQIGWTTSYHPRDVRWPLAKFGAETYIWPIWTADPGVKYTGVHPILDIYISNGYPKSSSDLSDLPPPTLPPFTDQPPPVTKAGINPLGAILLAGAAATLIYSATRKKKRA